LLEEEKDGNSLARVIAGKKNFTRPRAEKV
jgi:hypothetical protein